MSGFAARSPASARAGARVEALLVERGCGASRAAPPRLRGGDALLAARGRQAAAAGALPRLRRGGAEAGRRERPREDAACALEYVHTYSLVHDDLPAMDDDDLRRGRPTSHKVFGEAMAILAGDALLTEAFALLATGRRAARGPRWSPSWRGRRARRGWWAARCWTSPRTARPSEGYLTRLHRLKTGALIRAACRMGVLAAGGNGGRSSPRPSAYGDAVGLAFQIADDVLDVTATPRRWASPRAPMRRPAATPSRRCWGWRRSRARARTLVDEALGAVQRARASRGTARRRWRATAVERKHVTGCLGHVAVAEGRARAARSTSSRRCAPSCARRSSRICGRVGGHLGASLGAVELIVALHRVFHAPQDALVFDVGHQAYAHKLLTGRRARMHTLRQEGGVAPFLDPRESPLRRLRCGARLHGGLAWRSGCSQARARTRRPAARWRSSATAR